MLLCMPRKARIDAPGALHHVMVRGIERRKIFWADLDRDSFVDRLGEVLTHSHTSCFAWALMPNHVHLLLRTGPTPLPTVMRRVLTGYAGQFNRRHRRHGHLFQNRYKSVLCQEDVYLLELVRYIHLNPLRANLVGDYDRLNGFPYSGHCALMGRRNYEWQDTAYVLSLFGEKVSRARRLYSEYVEKGIVEGRRPGLVGGGLIRSFGGWEAVKGSKRMGERIKGDERILGDGEFVEEALRRSEERFERRYRYRALGYDYNWLVGRVAALFQIPEKEVTRQGRYPATVEARSVLCYWAVRELGMSTVELSRRLHISQPTASQSVKRGEKAVAERGLQVPE
jgi:putative transposase